MATATFQAAPSGSIDPRDSRPAPLDAEQQRELAAAQRRARSIRSAAGVARFNGWSIGLFAALSAPFAFFSLPGLFLALGMAIIAYGEFAGRRGLLRFDPAAATRLGWNQLGLLGLISVYCLWMTIAGLSGDGPFSAELAAKPELQEVLGSGDAFDETYRVVLVGFYGLVVALSAAFQGGNAWYYFSRGRQVEAYTRETPAWVIDLQRMTQPS